MDICKNNNNCSNNCSHDPNKIIALLETAKILYERLAKDVYMYVKELEKSQNYYQNFDLNSENMMNVMKLRLNFLIKTFASTFSNHLSVTANVKGIGEKIIKPVQQEYGTTTTIKYQNACSSCINKNGFISKKINDTLKIQTTINVATYDNISVNPIIDNSTGTDLGIAITIGKLTYNVNNYETLNLLYVIGGNESVEKVTVVSINTLFNFVDQQVKILGDIETSLLTNVEYINKYIKKFKQQHMC